jgi:hypothetical protein
LHFSEPLTLWAVRIWHIGRWELIEKTQRVVGN